jgi:hypothetical protein
MGASHILAFDDCPKEIRDLILECYERIEEAGAQAVGRFETVKAQLANGETPRHLPIELLQKIERYEIRIAILETLYYDQKFGFQQAREPLR